MKKNWIRNLFNCLFLKAPDCIYCSCINFVFHVDASKYLNCRKRSLIRWFEWYFNDNYDLRKYILTVSIIQSHWKANTHNYFLSIFSSLTAYHLNSSKSSTVISIIASYAFSREFRIILYFISKLLICIILFYKMVI